ncbi:MAG: tetrahydrofolate synthase [Treponema sp.]|nr:tetrahydrofolate synthase [Treponema sp.]
MNSPADVAEWLSRFENNERFVFYKPFTLDKMRLIANLAGNPETSAPVIHIAGSKGKGSVTAMIAAILEAEGIQTARYTSPQVTDYWDRICQGGGPFSDDIYVEAGRELVRVDELRTRKYPGEEKPSLFEMFTLLFFLCARIARVKAMVVETGLGGLHDATNVAIPVLSVLTLIELEHTEVLGNTIRAVAAQKAGIIKAGKPVIAAEQPEEALALFRETAAAKNAAFFYLPEEAALHKLRLSPEGTAFTVEYRGGGGALFPEPLDVSIPVPGAIQAWNAALAAAAAKTAFPLLKPEAVCRGLASLSLPARFERLLAEPVLIIDGAHTPRSVEALVETFASLYGEGGVLLFGCAASKDAAALARLLLPRFSRVIITTPGTYKASNPEDAYAAFRSLRGEAETPEITLIPDTAGAVELGLKKARETKLPILGTGSFYLAAEIRMILRQLKK